MQRQIAKLLSSYKKFAHVEIDDIIIFSQTLTDYLMYLKAIFSMLKENNISIKPIKAFLVYPIVQLLGTNVTSFSLSILDEKLKAILKLKFPLNLK